MSAGQRDDPCQRKRRHRKRQCRRDGPQSEGDTRTHRARMGDHDNRPLPIGETRQDRTDTAAYVCKALSPRWPVPREVFRRKLAEVGQIGEGIPFPFAEILFPKIGLFRYRLSFRPKSSRRFAAAPGRA